MMEKYTCNRFCKEVLLFKSEGTATKWRARGYIHVNDDGYVDIDKTIAILSSANASKIEYAKMAINFFQNGNMHIKNDIPNFEGGVNKHTENRNIKIIDYHDNQPQIITREDSQITLVDSMIDKNIIDTKLKKIQLNERVGKLIDRETVLRSYENILIGLKKDLLAMARAKIGIILREKDSPLVAEQILYDAIHEILEKNCKHDETY